ncbi:MAG: UDP-N-acetylmuramoyl-L-alanyl-D-glutamate--2,6-diaminopimelate ligase [Desulfobacterota bacterium]|nr:UDP-N-acetylmuramoyl-L-alanyl-D-glutamate--2,6-diaminopimelate ligase [Thermodesulfobacteriota bacterium]
MKLQQLRTIPDVVEFYGDEQYDITQIVTHSAQAGPEALFVAIPGSTADGHAFLQDAYQAGTRAFVTQHPFCRPGVANLVVRDTRKALAHLAARLYGYPSARVGLIGITGTNGKTTTAFLTESILHAAGTPTGLISTVVYRFGTEQREADRTTPDPVRLQSLLREMADAGSRYIVMEVSSHGLHQHRVDGCAFDVAVFTNLTPEHLDYHGTMEEYFHCKERFFTEVLPASSKPHTTAIINCDDPYGAPLIERVKGRCITYGSTHGDVYATRAALSLDGIHADIITPRGTVSIRSPLVGRFNLYNILAACAIATACTIPLEAIRQGIAQLCGVPGRMERVENDAGIAVFVDYAHTGDALAQVLETLKQAGAERIITVFGCGGDRDRQKRPVMGAVAARYSTCVILTSDNPRREDPHAIISEIEPGVQQQGYTKINAEALSTDRTGFYAIVPDRRSAITAAIRAARAGDVVLIAGKGHETYQEVHGMRTHFDDREVAREAFAQCSGGCFYNSRRERRGTTGF